MGVLDGLVVVELSIAIAGPSCGRNLAFHGAEVIKLESRANADVARLFGSAWATDISRDVYADTSPYLPEMSANKRSVGLNLKEPSALAAAGELLATADVFLTNYSTPAVRGLGLGYEDVVAFNPNIIYVALPGFGSDPTQPYYEFLAWGPNQAPLVGLDALTGYADQQPAGIATVAAPDYIAGLHAVTAVLTALEHRDRTGEGSYVDISQFETTVSFLGPLLLDHALSGRVARPDGNREQSLAPQGCYRGVGDDAWVAVTVADDREWVALAGIIGCSDTRFDSCPERIVHHDEIDELVSAWTATRTPADAAARLQAAGIAAYEVIDNIGVLHDPQIRDRRSFQMVPSSRFPDGDAMTTHPIRLSDTPGAWWRAGPSMGEDTRRVLTERTNVTDAGLDALIESGAAFEAAQPEQTLRRPYTDMAQILDLRRRGS